MEILFFFVINTKIQITHFHIGYLQDSLLISKSNITLLFEAYEKPLKKVIDYAALVMFILIKTKKQGCWVLSEQPQNFLTLIMFYFFAIYMNSFFPLKTSLKIPFVSEVNQDFEFKDELITYWSLFFIKP